MCIEPLTRTSLTFALVLLVTTGSAVAGVGAQVFVVDFEEFAEGTSISDQYAAVGVTFSIEGTGALPIIAREGAPFAAFSGSGTDSPMSSGSGGLTDPPIGNDFTVPGDIRIAFDPPVISASFYVIDLETGESVVATAFDGATPVASQTVVGATAGTGNGVSSPVVLAAASITSVLVDVTGPATGVGWAIDFLAITRPCPVPGCTLRLRVAQESAPGVGDFAAHVLGEVAVWSASTTSPAAFYGYNVPEGDSWNGAALTPVVDRSHLLGAVTSEGVTLFVVHDRAIPDNPDGGEAETRVELLGDPDGGFYAVQDDPPASKNGAYVAGAPGESIFAARHVWSPCCTDGYAVGGIACGATAIVQFTNVDGNASNAVIDGLVDWAAYGADGVSIPLVLVADRRVRLDVLPPENCPADLNCDGVVNGADLGILLGGWGALGGAPDIDGSGLVDGADLGVLLGAWGTCA